MEPLARISIEGGGSVLIEASGRTDGPVKAGRLGDAIQELPISLQETLTPVTAAAKAIQGQLRKAGPAEIEVEFGVDLAAKAGAVFTRGEAACHLKVKMTWKNDGSP